MKNFFKEYFTLSYSERNGLVLLLLILFMVLSIPRIYDFFRPSSDLKLNIASLPDDESLHPHLIEPDKKALFPFNPNTVSASELDSLGLDSMLIAHILNYRVAGGRFYEKDDLLRIYNMSKEEYLRLEPFIRIPDKKYRAYRENPVIEKRQNRNTKPFDINNADSAQWLALPGIGPVFAKRIIELKEKKGFFRKPEELLEVYGMDTDRFKKILPFLLVSDSVQSLPLESEAVPALVRFELNTVDSLTLIKIRGVGPWYAHRILKYRKALGGFYRKEQLYEVDRIDSSLVSHILELADLDTTLIRKMNINKADKSELAAHPYISWAIADAIIRIRLDYVKIEDKRILLKSYLVDEELLRKIAPYIKL